MSLTSRIRTTLLATVLALAATLTVVPAADAAPSGGLGNGNGGRPPATGTGSHWY